MRDPLDALTDVFFSLKTFRVVVGMTIGGGLLTALAGCNPQHPAATTPSSGPAPQIITAAVGQSRTFRVRHPSGAEALYTIITQPETGCEYIQAGNHALTPNMARTGNGSLLQVGCRVGAFEEYSR